VMIVLAFAGYPSTWQIDLIKVKLQKST